MIEKMFSFYYFTIFYYPFYYFYFCYVSVHLISITNTLKRNYGYTTISTMKLNGIKFLGAHQAQEQEKVTLSS